MIRIRKNVPLKPLSTFKIGGRARYFCTVKNDLELLDALSRAKKLNVPYSVIAGGSNIVFPDRNINSLLIKITSNTLLVSGRKIITDAGVPLSRVVAAANRSGLRGLETLAGIPGTIGGAIVGNAGAYGHSISRVIERVEIFSDGKKRWLTNKECCFLYRDSIFKRKPYIVLRAALKFKRGQPAELKKISRDIIRVRLRKYTPGLRCPGSFFKNVLVKNAPKRTLRLIDRDKIIDNKIPAGYLLEEVGAKGMRIGNVRVAQFHGNLFINKGNAKARDIKRLARVLRSRVEKRFGISLEEEIRYF